MESKSDISVPLVNYEKRNRLANSAIDVAALQCHAKVIDPAPYLCEKGQCKGSKGGAPLYFDDNHLVDSDNEQLRGMYRFLAYSGQASGAPLSLGLHTSPPHISTVR
ncbi:SGNH hydrolase domain-containing protein [Pseudomonas sp. HY7a-MNA-CIBAN-0227]|uniref:SGNH hydrolase domain-containing protein n=1 Tax=Pseudomonas sp. HY7a-MNA-CIBAN-0227 TaxID=3140474 RepID=UPI0033179B1D